MLTTALLWFGCLVIYIMISVFSYLSWIRVLTITSYFNKDEIEAISFAFSLFWFIIIPMSIAGTVLYFLVSYIYKAIFYVFKQVDKNVPQSK